MSNNNNIIHSHISLDEGAKGAMIILFFGQLFLSNGLYLLFGATCLGFCLYNLQRPFKPSVFTLILIYHFVQISANIWLSNYLDRDIDWRSDHTGDATIFAFIGVVFMIMPIIYYQNKLPSLSFNKMRVFAERLSIKRTFKVYIIAFFVANTLAGLAFVVSGLAQVIFSILNVKWFLFLLFGYQVILKKKMVKEFIIVSSVEFLVGFLSYFSDFKTIFFFLAFLGLSFIVIIRFKHVMIAAVVISLSVFLGIKWTSIKGEYRNYLNQGSQSQKVNVSNEDAINKLLELSSKNGDESEGDATFSFLDRIQYTHHLAKTMDRVPDVLPHEYGSNIGSILEFVFTPRILNPTKPKLEATVKATKYTGIMYAGARTGTSFSLGYFADCYIDFGYYGMMIPLLILGFIFGSSYFYFAKKSSNNLVFNYAVVGGMFMEFTAFESDGTYIMGRLFATLVTFFLLKTFFFPWLYRYLQLEKLQKVSNS